MTDRTLKTTVEHEAAFHEAVRQWADGARKPDNGEYALLYVFTFPKLAHKVEGRISYRRASIDWEDLEKGVSTGEFLLLQLARILFEGHGDYPIAELASLSGEWWHVAMRALELHRMPG